jgi:hypothetical protein
MVIDRYNKRALSLVKKGENLFITGEAGTGKSTLLRKIVEELQGKRALAVIAPTGVAAENVKASTIHHFFSFKPFLFLPGHKNKEIYQLDEGGIALVKRLELLIIDEVSMVRCDMLDAIDEVLRYYRKSKEPFGGIQLVMFGDLYQLSPVVTREDEAELSKYYNSYYFFSCKALQKMNYKMIQLKVIYRQDDPVFIEMLNHVRKGKLTKKDIEILDERVEPNYRPGVKDGILTVMTHNKMTNDWNEELFGKLRTKMYYFGGEKSKGWYGETPVPTDLYLKKGSRVMFLRNDNNGNRYQNGTLGWVEEVSYFRIKVRPDGGEPIYVEQARWEQNEYYVDEKTKEIKTRVKGSFTQYPLKLAWAVSIHKSQGLTFDELAIEASKAFTYGQVYVALSRCTNLKGIHLLSQIPVHTINADPKVDLYLKSIDRKGNVNLPEELEPNDIERSPLRIWIRYNTYRNFKNGTKQKCHRAISDGDLAGKIFKHKNGKLCVQKAFKDIKKDWHFWDDHEGHCPFIIRQYKKVIFEVRDYPYVLEAEITGQIKTYETKDTDGDACWGFEFYVRNVKEKRIEGRGLIATIVT